jgi:NAD-dependent dihydropyrimidine dehydrogenase PreA subunit
MDLCFMATGKSTCGKCVQACPSGAVKLVTIEDGKRIPTVAEEVCTGCGACEFLCPSRPISAITVNGKHQHV